MSVFGEIYTTGKNFCTAGGSDGSDKSHLCRKIPPFENKAFLTNSVIPRPNSIFFTLKSGF